jgi:hypothetical protein
MTRPTATIERLCARLAAVPSDFLGPVAGARVGVSGVAVDAVVADLFRDRVGETVGEHTLEAFRLPSSKAAKSTDARVAARRHLEAVLLATWLVHDEAFAGISGARLRELLTVRMRELSELVATRAFTEDPDRREELVRVCLGALGVAPEGESVADAEDRLTALDSVKRTRLLREARAREEERERERQRKKLEELRRQEAEAKAREAAKSTYED